MPTVHIPQTDDMSDAQREVVTTVARREGVDPDALSLVYRAKIHWPEYLEATSHEVRYDYKALRTLPDMTKEAIHVTVSMVNKCDF